MNPRRIRHPLRSFWGRLEIVGKVLQRWRWGLPLRTAAKILRKAGIHPLSLVVCASPDERDRLIGELHAPDPFAAAIRQSLADGLVFLKVQGQLQLPEGLVVRAFSLIGCHDVVRLPRRLWSGSVEAADCARLHRLSLGGGRVWHLEADQCPRLRGAALHMVGSGSVRLTDCPRMKVLPKGYWINIMTLKDLPGIQALPFNLSRVNQLSIWRLPRLRDLSRLTVNRRLELQDCLALQLLPQVGKDICGSVRGCPALLDQVLPPDAKNLLVAPTQEPSRVAGARPMPGSQEAEPVPLTGFSETEGVIAWPWPPQGIQRSELDVDIERTGRALGMPPQDRLELHVAAGATAASVVQGLMRQAADPVEAIGMGARLLSALLSCGDLRGALEVCLSAEQLGLGALSLGLSAQIEQHRSGLGLNAVLGPFWGARVRNAKAPGILRRLEWYDSESVPGPLVLTRGTYLSQNTCLRWIDGPVWSGQPLWISDCPRLERLPDLIVVKGGLTIESCPRLTTFPRRLEVAGDLTLRNLPGLWAQRCRIQVDGEVRVEGCPGLRLDRMDRN